MTSHLPTATNPAPLSPRALVVSRLLPYKKVDVAIRACALSGIGLTIVGEGPEKSGLQALANGDVSFLGRVDDQEMAQLFIDHSVLLAPGLEDFGYGPVEANYAGRPVIAIGAGGALETIKDGLNGALVSDWNPANWSTVISTVLSKSWSPSDLRATTERFGGEVFAKNIHQWIEFGVK